MDFGVFAPKKTSFWTYIKKKSFITLNLKSIIILKETNILTKSNDRKKDFSETLNKINKPFSWKKF